MEKVMPELFFRELKTFTDFTAGNAVHRDKKAILNLPPEEIVVITKSLFAEIKLVGQTHAIIFVGDAASPQKIIAKDDTTVIVRKGTVYAKGKSTVYAYGTFANVYATNLATIYMYDEAYAEAEQHSKVWLYGETTAKISNDVTAYAGCYSVCEAENNSKIIDCGTTAYLKALTDGENNIKKADILTKYLYKQNYKKGMEKINEAKQKFYESRKTE